MDSAALVALKPILAESQNRPRSESIKRYNRGDSLHLSGSNHGSPDKRLRPFSVRILRCGSGHADRVMPLHDYCTGLQLRGDRKSVEPMAALTAPARISAKHQSLLHFVAQAPWSDKSVPAKMRQIALPGTETHGVVEACIINKSLSHEASGTAGNGRLRRPGPARGHAVPAAEDYALDPVLSQTVPVSADDLTMMRRMGELFVASPFYGSRRMQMVLRREGVAIHSKRRGGG